MDKKYYEKVPMKGKEVEDVFGGSKEFENADTVASEFSCFFFFPLYNGSRYFLVLQLNVLPKTAVETARTFSNYRFGVQTSL